MSPERKLLLQMLGLMVVVAGLGLFVWKGIYEPGERETKQKEHDTRLFAPQKMEEKLADGGSPPAEFTKVVLTSNGVTSVMERTPPGPWMLVSPEKGKVDPLVADTIVSQLQQSKFKATVEETPDAAALKKYGLDTPVFTVEATARVAGETRSVKLEGGIENTFDGSIFMRRNGEPTVYAAEGGVRFSFDKQPFDLREKRVFALEEPKVTAIAMTSKANAWKLERGADKLWKLVAPETGGADATAVKSMIDTLSSERAQGFPEDTPANRAAFGLEQPIVDATLTLQEGGTVRLRFGHPEIPDGGAATWYGLREDGEGAVLAQVNDSAAGQLDRTVIDLRDKSIIPFNKELVTRVVFHNADGSEVVVAKPQADAGLDSWTVTAPTAGKAKVFKVTSALWVLGALKASKVIEPDTKNGKKYGLGAASRFVALYGPAPETLAAKLTIGDPVPDQAGSFYATGTRGEVVMVDGSRFGELPVKVEDVLDVPDAGSLPAFLAADAGAP